MDFHRQLAIAGVFFGVAACAGVEEGEPLDAVPLGNPGGPAGSSGGTGGIDGPVVPPGIVPQRLALRTAANSPPPISGGTLAVRGDGQVVVAADPDRDAVFIVKPASLGVVKLALEKGSEPGRVAFDSSGVAHVALRGSGKLLRVDPGVDVASVETVVCEHPRGVAHDVASDAVVVACADGQVVSLEAGTHRELSRQQLERDLRDVVVGPEGRLFVSRYRSAELLEIGDDGVSSRHKPAVAERQSLGIFDGSQPSSEFRTVSLSPALAWRTLGSSNGSMWMLHQQSQDDEVVVTANGYGGGCETITQATVTAFDAAGAPKGTVSVLLNGLTVDAAISPDSSWLAVASPGAYLQGRPTLQLYSAVPQPTVPFSGCTGAAGMEASTSQVVAVSFDGAGLLYVLSREPAELSVYAVPGPVQDLAFPDGEVPFGPFPPALNRQLTIALDPQSARDTGHDMFHTDVGQGLSCAACHGEAVDDAHVWTFQDIGPRRTQSMRGGIMGTAPFHWDGDMPSFGHLIDEVMTSRMGGFVVQEEFAAALSAWVDRQPALRLRAQDSSAVERGAALFASDKMLCATCHRGDVLTNNEWADVGTGGSFQVPQLLGLALRAPYMHDGCAKTLEDRFKDGCGGGDRHGKTSQLTPAELSDLLAYLETL